MRARQVLDLVAYRLLRRSRAAGSPAAVKLSGNLLAIAPVAIQSDQDLEAGAGFLNRYVPFDHGKVDWRAADQAKLWRYNLHYFDYLLWPRVTGARKRALIESWIKENPLGAEDAWEPYTVSLRLVNWIKFLLLEMADAEIPVHWVDSLALQAAWLERNLETHILANHYLKNAKALVFAGAFFEGERADAWRNQGVAIFSAQLDEQFMASGAHYELSPMYHCICVEDILDVLNLVQQKVSSFGEDFVRQLQDTARRGLDFLAALLLPDGRIPLFNDSAFGIAPEPDALFAYAERLFDYTVSEGLPMALPDAGYFVLGDELNRMVIDCGPVSPPYQPGHTHCDMLSYELALDGRRIVVDAGVHDYENSDARRYCRSTAAHNTVSVDEAEQSELWGVFRVARRARPVAASLRRLRDGGTIFEGELAGFPAVDGEIRHHRLVEYQSPNVWSVTDQVRGSGEHSVDSFIHLHPDFRLHCDDGIYVVEDDAGACYARIEPFGAAAVELIEGWHYPEFGMAQGNSVLRLHWHGSLPATFGYRILGIDPAPVN